MPNNNLVGMTGDVHAHPFSDYATVNEEGINSRLLETCRVLRWMIQSSFDRKCSKFIVAGDLLHVRKDIPTVALDLVSEVFQEFKDKLEIVLLVGNHDLNVNSYHTGLRAFRGSCRVIASPQVVDGIGYFPWTDDQETASKVFRKLMDKGATRIVGHMGISGAKIGPSSFEVPGHIELETIKGLDALEWIVLGHYHKHQNVRGNIWYVGSPLQHDRGERNDGKKGFFIANGAKLEFIENTTSPRFLDVYPDTPAASIRANDFVKIIGRTEEEVTELRAIVEKKGNKSESTKTEVIVIPETKQRLDLAGASERNLLRRYVKHEGRPTGIKRRTLIDAGLQFLQGAQE